MHSNNAHKQFIHDNLKSETNSIRAHLKYTASALRNKEDNSNAIEQMLNKIIALDPTALEVITPPTPSVDKSKMYDNNVFKFNE